MLIQFVDNYFLVGIGINLFDAPRLLVDSTGAGEAASDRSEMRKTKDVIGETVEESFRGR